jgi:hypothetical protein
MKAMCIYRRVAMAEFTHYRVLNDEVLPILEGSSPAAASGGYLQNFLHNLQIKILSLNEETIVFDLIGVDTSIANALRRILLAEVPTMAIETIYIQDNTSIVQDEVLSHRLGLVPIFADPDQFEDFPAGSDPTDLNTIVFKLDVTCTNDPAKTVLNDSGLLTQSVYSGDFEWQPQGDQAEKFTGIATASSSTCYLTSLPPPPQIPSALCTATSLW